MSLAYLVTTYNSGHWLRLTLDHLPRNARVQVLDTARFDGNLNRTWNYGIRTLLGEGLTTVVMVLNDDVILRPDTGDLLADGLLNQSDVEWTDRELLLLSARHAAHNDNRTNEADWDLLNAAEPKFQPGPDFACFVVTRKLFEEVGEFDEGFQIYASDNDMHRRIQLAGYEAGAYAPFWHCLNGTIRANPERQLAVHPIFEHDVAYYKSKWGGWLGEERYLMPYGKESVASL